MLFNLSELHYLAIIAGGFLYMIYGTIYYSILLGKKKEGQSEGPSKYIVSVIVAFVSSLFVAILVQTSGAEGLLEGAAVGMIIGILITIVYLKNSLFGLVTKKAFYIVIGDHLTIFTLLGALHGLLL
ncbi:DUF1761 domain-containing protein [Peribacillus loiseleuriae]|uniref:DUF1761 domain-containing protein n=1 Tax=Peribacillus loiseleuriae TaxID=1679170 RepID=A0A0K9GXS0_9BACI|nr:DUF1761 domain-containing protein [Peribacillus loiseleuriae]KMY51411.1 hypothetical protein AC625_19215 [Peribacillus loiseleuriae]